MSLVRPHMEYCSHTWAGAAKCHLELLNKIQRRATRIIGDTNLTSQPLLLSMLVVRWPLYLCFTAIITVTVLIVLLS